MSFHIKTQGEIDALFADRKRDNFLLMSDIFMQTFLEILFHSWLTVIIRASISR
jgi:hypothetical protein